MHFDKLIQYRLGWPFNWFRNSLARR